MLVPTSQMGKVMATDVPLVSDVGLGLDDLIAAVEQLMTPRLRAQAGERAAEVKNFTDHARQLRAGIVNNPEWNNAPLIADRVTWEVAQFADTDAIIVHEAGSVAMHSFNFNPVGGRELFFYYGGPHSRAIANVPSGRMVETGQYVGSYLGSPDMNMASIAAGFGVKGEVVNNPQELKAALARAKKSTVEGKPYLIDVQVARRGIGWTEAPWIPPIKGTAMRTKKV